MMDTETLQDPVAHSKIRIVLADDHAILRAGITSLLNCEGDIFVVAEATNGDEALDFVNKHKPDILILDLSMPKNKDMRVLKELTKAQSPTKVLVLTMHEDHAYLRAVIKEGGAGYLVKRAADTDLLAAIRQIYNGGSYIDASLSAEALRYVLNPTFATSPLPPLSVLSAREKQVLLFIAQGYTNKETANDLNVSVKTIETYRLRLSDKLGLRSRAQLVKYAIQSGIFKTAAGDSSGY
jgi:two-component system, NarL family, response regulator NreC